LQGVMTAAKFELGTEDGGGTDGIVRDDAGVDAERGGARRDA
jgi:hypothetical protein